ncbi:hypothetical protein VP01_1863g4 [Puccinia sorghi]|uniref:Uncharacterized protein n=1 Tax=Puccinia sorghi TaxID=27349 RepID=A0A0L6VF89_9BASI|nr:hypothetical protein VP01_1863g4 [Puccinia sorghi]
MYAIAATHQHQASSHETVAMVKPSKMKARMAFLIPMLQAYSNSPNKSRSLPKTLYYLYLDAVDKQPGDWREENLLPGQLKDKPSGAALRGYGTIMGALLKYQ